MSTAKASMGVSLLFVGLGIAFAFPNNLGAAAACALFFCTGVLATHIAIRSNTAIALNFPGRVGEVSGEIQAWQSGAMLVAPWIAALVIPHVAVSTVFIADGAAGFLAFVAVSVIWSKMRNRGALHAPATSSQ
jgi:hypothetical protein